MKSKMLYSGFCLLVLIGLFGCEKFHKVEGNHHVVTETRDLGAYTEVHSAGIYEVEINHDSVYGIVIEAEENLLPYIKTEVSGSVLHLGVRENRNLKPSVAIKIRISMPNLTGVKLSGSGSIVTDTFNVTHLDADISGSGSVNLCVLAGSIDAQISGSGEMEIKGSADEATYGISGSGDIRAIQTPVADVRTKISGSGSIYVNALETLDVDISGSGSVYYIGQPVISTHITGSGKVVQY